MNYEVTVSNQALEEMVLAASESFLLGNARKYGPVEIHGYLWGSRREVEGIEYLDVEKVSVSASALGDEDSILVDPRVVRIKNSILRLWAPHHHFLGEFHTHPYNNLEDVNRNNGWDFSDEDVCAFLSDEDIWELSYPEMPIQLVVAVTKIGAVHDTFSKLELDGRRLQFNVGNLRFWLSVGVGEVSRGQEKTFSKENIVFHPFNRHFNQAGVWLDGTEESE